MPAKTERQRRFFAADRERAKEGKRTKTGLSKEQLNDFVYKTPKSKRGK